MSQNAMPQPSIEIRGEPLWLTRRGQWPVYKELLECGHDGDFASPWPAAKTPGKARSGYASARRCKRCSYRLRAVVALMGETRLRLVP